MNTNSNTFETLVHLNYKAVELMELMFDNKGILACGQYAFVQVLAEGWINVRFVGEVQFMREFSQRFQVQTGMRLVGFERYGIWENKEPIRCDTFKKHSLVILKADVRFTKTDWSVRPVDEKRIQPGYLPVLREKVETLTEQVESKGLITFELNRVDQELLNIWRNNGVPRCMQGHPDLPMLLNMMFYDDEPLHENWKPMKEDYDSLLAEVERELVAKELQREFEELHNRKLRRQGLADKPVVKPNKEQPPRLPKEVIEQLVKEQEQKPPAEPKAETKPSTQQKKPKTHFRKSQKPGRV